jgi:glycosyltransferase involved in cell wall biosynthesis
MQPTLISICIPAYKRVHLLERLLKSIGDQTFRNFEVVITDDSPDDSVYHCVAGFSSLFPIRYFRNAAALGTPENWNEAVRKANGEWIKIMHDDDFFTSAESLGAFAAAASESPATSHFIFSSFYNVTESTGRRSQVTLSGFRKTLLRQNAVSLLSRNVIGPPSVTLYRNNRQWSYDRRLKWLVDMDFYIQVLGNSSFTYLDSPLVGIGVHGEQVTAVSSLNPSVEIPEHMLLLEKYGLRTLRNIPFYDAYWRILRNLGLYDEAIVEGYNQSRPLPDPVKFMLRFQSRIPVALLRFGPVSKLLMLACYSFQRLNRSLGAE